jgi:signal transduction histidine kinase
MAGSMKDITQRKETEAELLRTEKLAAMGMTIANIAHSMKNLFMAVTGGIAPLNRFIDPPTEKQREVLDLLESSTRRLHLLIMNMLDFSKEREFVPEQINCANLFAELNKLVYSAANKKGIRFISTIGPGAETFNLDGERLLRALLNLAGNAIDAAPAEGGRIEVRAFVSDLSDIDLTPAELAGLPASDSPALVIEVEDNGDGIPEDVRSRIFEPFFSTKSSRGTGLGLPSVLQFVRESRGLVHVESTPAAGSKFQLVFLNALASQGDLHAAAV